MKLGNIRQMATGSMTWQEMFNFFLKYAYSLIDEICHFACISSSAVLKFVYSMQVILIDNL